MGLKNYQYNQILREYDSRQLQNKRDLKKRTEEIYKKIPIIKEIDNKIVTDSIRLAKLSVENEETSAVALKRQNEVLSQRKKELLQQYGYPQNYLSLQYHCPACKDTGYIGSKKCNCFKQAIVNLLYHQSNLSDVLEKENFSTFSLDYYAKDYIDPATECTPYENAKRALSICSHFIKHFDHSHENLLIYGNTGVGKTFLANCIAKKLLDSGHMVIYLTAFQLFDILEKYAYRQKKEDEDVEAPFDYILNCDLLIIDDLGTELTNSFISSRLYLCINERHLSQKSTLISTNLSLDDLNLNYSERIFSRITSDYILLKMVGEDIRIKKVFHP